MYLNYQGLRALFFAFSSVRFDVVSLCVLCHPSSFFYPRPLAAGRVTGCLRSIGYPTADEDEDGIAVLYGDG